MNTNGNKPTRLLLIRHGETPWTREKRYQGVSDILLTARGRKQARALAVRLHSERIDELVASPLSRAYATAAAIAERMGREVLIDTRLRELDFGDWEGKTAGEILRKKDRRFQSWCRGNFVTPPGGESFSSLRARARQFLAGLLRAYRGRCVAVVTHGGPIITMIYETLKISRPFWFLQVEPASVSVLNFYPEFSQLALLNDTGHLKAIS